MIRVKLRRQKTEIPGNPVRAIDDMEMFVVVAREGSFAAAARGLGVSTSVVADAIVRLERRLTSGSRCGDAASDATDAGREYAARRRGFSSALARSRSASGTTPATPAAISELQRRRRSDGDGLRPSSRLSRGATRTSGLR